MPIGIEEADWSQILFNLERLVVAYALTLPIGWNREKSKRSFGMRTFPLVATVTCGFMLTGISAIQSTEGKARIIQGIITGIGFIGGGAIFKKKSTVSGTASAVSIWNAGAIGVAVAFARYEIALLLSIINFLTLAFVKELKNLAQHEDSEDSSEEGKGDGY